LKVLEAVDIANDRQKLIPFNKVLLLLDDLKGKTIAIWGLAFKPATDDIRESPAIYIINELLAAGAKVRAHDPIAISNFKQLVTEEPIFEDDQYSTLDGADALIVVTDWPVYKDADLGEVAKRLKGNTVIDGRNIWAHKARPSDWRYEGIGLGNLTN
jgi:UDPglucose 6-dehydrogenase